MVRERILNSLHVSERKVETTGVIMRREYSKKTKKLMRELMGKTYEEELRRALIPLSEAFDQWKEGGTESGELSDLIHEFNRGPARKLFVNYDGKMDDFMVASAVARGILDRKEVPQELLEQLADLIEFCEKEMT